MARRSGFLLLFIESEIVGLFRTKWGMKKIWKEKRYKSCIFAGHIDGKTWLVKALTGTDTDRLAEEKSEGLQLKNGLRF